MQDGREVTVREPEALPRPLYDGWAPPRREAARALWHWHVGLQAAAPVGRDVPGFYAQEAERAAAGEPLRVLPEPVWKAAYAAREAHGLPPALLAAQVNGAAAFQGPIRFPSAADLNAFLEQWALPHGRLLACLADAAHSWQARYVDELTGAFFLVGRLAELPRDLARDRLFLPLADLDQAGVSVEQLRAGRVDERVRKLLWKQTIRARDSFAQGLPLVHELTSRQSRQLRTWWLGGLELLNELERRDYDVWRRPLRLSGRHRLQVRFQARFARTTFRAR